MITSWAPRKQDVLELFMQSHCSLTAKLQAHAALEGSVSYIAFVASCYSHSEPVNQYKCVLAVASGFSIAGVIPYLRQLLYGYSMSTSSVCYVHFVWQVITLDKNVLL